MVERALRQVGGAERVWQVCVCACMCGIDWFSCASSFFCCRNQSSKVKNTMMCCCCLLF